MATRLITVLHDSKTEVVCSECHKPIKKGKRAIAQHYRGEHSLYISERDIELHEEGWSICSKVEMPEIDWERINEMAKLFRTLTPEEKEWLLSED